MPALVYPTSDFQPFTKIYSSEVNGKFSAIKTLLNTTGLDSTNIQVGGVALTRLVGTANAFVANSAAAVVTAYATAANQTIYTSTDGSVTVGTLPTRVGGTGLAFAPVLADASKVLQVNSLGTALTFDTTPTPAPLRIYNNYRFG
jgi:hypothetical protein